MSSGAQVAPGGERGRPLAFRVALCVALAAVLAFLTLPLVAIFRDPLERLFSHWTMLRTRHPDWPDWPGF